MPIYLALIAFAVMGLFMITAGVLGIQYSRLWKLGVIAYAYPTGWMFFGGMFGAVVVLGLLGNAQMTARANWLTTIIVYVGLPVSLFVLLSSAVSLRNARHLAIKEREDFTKTKQALMSWKDTKRRLTDG